MNAHTPFDAKQDWSNPYCQNSSNDPMVDALLGNAYHVVRTVYCNLGNLKLIYDFLNQYGMVLGVQSEAELKALTTKAKYARIYGFSRAGDRQVTDYLYVEGDRTGIIPDDPKATGSWITVATSGSSGGGTSSSEGAYIPWVYANGSATGGETSINVPDGTVGVPFIIINGDMQYVGRGFEFNADNLSVTLAQPLEEGDEVVFLLTGVPAVPDNPNVNDWVQINWLYNNGAAVGGEQVITIPYTFQSIPAVYKNGLRLYKGLTTESYSTDPDNQRIFLTEQLATNDRLIIQIGGEAQVLEAADHTLQEVARVTNVKDSEVILSTDTIQFLNDKKVIYDVVAQKIYGLPTLPTNVYINSVSNGQLTYSPGNITVDLNPAPSSGIDAANTLRADLASGDLGLGDNLLTVKQPFTGSVVRTQHSKNTDLVSVKDFGAVGDGVTDDTVAIKAAIAYAGTIKGVVYFPDGNYKISSTLALPSNVSVIGRSRESVTITKTTSTTVTVLVTAPALSGGYTGTLPTDMNAVICLGDSSSSRWSGVITGVTLYGTKTTTENHAVEFGIVNTGVVSDAKIEDVYVYDCKYGLTLPVVFSSQVENNRVTACLGGLFINNGTSCVISTNYSNSCRDYGHWYRDLKYSVIEANACDYTNRNDYYPDRARVCYGYVFQNLLGVTVTGNGQEGTLGTNWRLDNFDHSSFTSNTSIRLGSDYVGSSNISWLELNGVARNSIIENNVSYEYNSNGMLFGGAIAGQHHNIYISDITFFNAILHNNIVRSTRNGVPVEAGWLNNVTRTVANSSAKIRPDRTFVNGDAGSPTLAIQSGTDAVISYGEYTVHNVNYVGDFAHVFGVFDVTITWNSGTSQFISVTGFPTARDYAYIAVTGVNNGDVGFTSGNIPASFRMNIGSTGGAFFTEGEKTLRIDAVVSGKRLYISYDGWYRVSP